MSRLATVLHPCRQDEAAGSKFATFENVLPPFLGRVAFSPHGFWASLGRTKNDAGAGGRAYKASTTEDLNACDFQAHSSEHASKSLT